MNGVHDMGGMHGMGPVQPEINEPVFHERWESRVYVLTRAIGPWRKWNIDTGRYYIERIAPARSNASIAASSSGVSVPAWALAESAFI